MVALLHPSIEAGELAEQRGDFLEASSAFEAALEDHDPLVVATARNCLGKLAWRQGAHDVAFASFEKARASAIRHSAVDIRARAELGLGNVYYGRGDYVRARELYDGVRNSATTPGLRAKAMLNLGIIANIAGDAGAAEGHYRRACRAFTDAEDIHGQAQSHHNLGMLHADRLELDEADVAYREALLLSEKTGNREMAGLVLMNQARLSCAMGRYDDAVARCDAALAILAEMGAEVLRGTTLRWKGRAQRHLGQLAESERTLTEATRIARRTRARLLEAEVMHEIGATHRAAGNDGAARKWLRSALAVFAALGAAREASEVKAELSALSDDD